MSLSLDFLAALQNLISIPGLRARLSAPPLGAFPSRGGRVGFGLKSPLEENDLGGLRH